jgi:hypothetical protein
VTGFVFKVQANMDPNHRDRVAFLRLCSGRFRRGMKLTHVREGRSIAVASPILFFAQQRETADEAYAGDIIGIPNHGTMRVGDTFSEGETLKFQGIPNFAPELLRRVLIEDAMKAKQLNRALHDLARKAWCRCSNRCSARAPSWAWWAPCSSMCCSRGCRPSTGCRCASRRRRAWRRAGCRATTRTRSHRFIERKPPDAG